VALRLCVIFTLPLSFLTENLKPITDNRIYIPMPPKLGHILESSLYVDDLPRSLRFYQEIFGFPVLSDFAERGCALHAGPHQVLLLFKKGASRAITSPHDGNGELHLAFAIAASELPTWESWLRQHNIAIEEKRQWQLGGWSIYFRDPDRHLLELATPGTWPVY
jgi:catechol 2,3-dioxygenase-like lactoylglutathione lyase family enzyme